MKEPIFPLRFRNYGWILHLIPSFLLAIVLFELNSFLRSQNIAKIQEKEGDIPEIGGMLLGHPQQVGAKYQTTIEKFVPYSI